MTPAPVSPLDRLGRPLRNLRVSVTDRCNLRCAYCMPEEEYVWLPREDLLTFEETRDLVSVFAGLGVDKVRLTGGEPLLRRDLPALVRLLVRAGAAQDPEKKGGVADLVANLLDQGTATRSAQQIADQIDSIGGAMGTGSGPDLTFVNAVVMKDSFAVAMDLLADVVRNPAFAPEEIERQKEQAISSLRVSSNDPDYVASVVFDRLVYGFHPYGLPGSGTPETLASITRRNSQRVGGL